MQRQLSLLVGVQYIDKLLMCSCDAVAGPLHAALLCNAWLDSEYTFCVSSWVLWPFCSYFLREGQLGSRGRFLSCSTVLGLRVSLNGEVCTNDASVLSCAVGRT